MKVNKVYLYYNIHYPHCINNLTITCTYALVYHLVNKGLHESVVSLKYVE